MEQVKAGVIGVGRMGQRHCRVYSTMRKVQLVGVCDVNPELGTKVAAQYEVPYYQDIDDLLGQVDAVSLAAPTQQHFDLVMKCIARGVHVLVEKPIAETLEQAEQLVVAAEADGLVIQVGHIERFNPVYMELKNVLEELPPLAVNIQRLSPYQGSNVDVDVVLDLMIHDTNLILDLMGRYPEGVNAFGLTAYSGTVDHAVVQLCYTGGPIVSMTSSRVTEHKVRSINVTSREAYLECDLLNKSLLIHRATIGEYINANKKGVKYRQESLVERINIPSFEPLFLQLQHFVDSVLEDKCPLVTARNGYEALKLAVEIRDCILDSMVNMDRRKTPRTPGATRHASRVTGAVR
jgi:predicted dehydrogenase